ncbi:CHASE3 domain-containing protein [Beijerinckia sp. L45]|uniref:CHASE3 domain-containing protein n=1 Tax=Beijerinckia sp. L45 TaxID=1641855 RepID=UPI00131E5E19|nr:CHASE3 domain-containing protein [Beijerinckia sp. L45]
MAAAFLLLAAVILATAGLVGTQERVAHDVLQAVDNRNELDALFSALQDAETGQRGYILTKSDLYLKPYENVVGEIGGLLRGLERRYAGEPTQLGTLAALRAASDDKLLELSQTIALRKADQGEAALTLVRSDRGRLLMDRIRALVATLRNETYADMVARQSQAASSGRNVEVAIAFAVVVTLGLGVFVVASAWRRNRRLTETLDGLSTAHDALRAEITHRERAEQQLRQSQKMEALGHLTGGLAHDFNNMLAIVIGNLNLVRRRLDRGDQRIDQNIAHALEGAERATTLTHRLLAFARRQPLSPVAADLNQIVPNVSELLRRTLGETIRIETVLAGGLWLSHVDANQLESALVNLAVNARDAMPDGGKLTIETVNAHLDDSYVAENPGAVPGQYVLLAVSDAGSGMAADVVAQAFDPFFTTKSAGKGTGLGLSQVYGFVKQSAGHIKIYSEVGKGTTVKIYLPRLVAAKATLPKSATRDDSEVPVGSPRELILVVEDEDRVRRMTVETLRDLQYSVIHANGAAHALQLLESHPDITLLFTDVVMPEIGGKQLADTAIKQRPDLKVLFTTGYTRNAVVHNGIIDAGVHLIGKPFTVAQLASKVRQVITDAA